MNKIIGTMVLVLACAFPAQADRASYTSETVAEATIIGVWYPTDIKKHGESMVLQKPSRLLKGEFVSLQKATSYSPNLRAAVGGITNHGEILFIRVTEELADLVMCRIFLPLDAVTMKAVSYTINQLETRALWDTFTVQEQIEHSDVIVTGSFSTTEEEMLADQPRFIAADATLRGISPKKLVVLPDGVPVQSGRFLFMLQRYFGSGPEYMLMRSIPIENATKYLDVLRRKGSQPASPGDGKSAPEK